MLGLAGCDLTHLNKRVFRVLVAKETLSKSSQESPEIIRIQ
jgi:hypothetical protein